MVSREGIVKQMEVSRDTPQGHGRTELLLHCVLQSNGILMEELFKLRKELRVRNEGENG